MRENKMQNKENTKTPKVLIVLTEGDVLIDKENNPMKVSSGEVTVYTDGSYKGGELVFTDNEYIALAMASNAEILNLNEI
jgi:hypothetical protein